MPQVDVEEEEVSSRIRTIELPQPSRVLLTVRVLINHYIGDFGLVDSELILARRCWCLPDPVIHCISYLSPTCELKKNSEHRVLPLCTTPSLSDTQPTRKPRTIMQRCETRLRDSPTSCWRPLPRRYLAWTVPSFRNLRDST